MDYLALQVGFVDNVVVDDADPAYPGGCQVEGYRGTQPARPDQQDRSGFQFALAFKAYLRD
jgi:hypothetical protein